MLWLLKGYLFGGFAGEHMRVELLIGAACVGKQFNHPFISPLDFQASSHASFEAHTRTTA